MPHSKRSPKQLVVLLHGYGSNGDDLISLADLWAQDLEETEFIAPHAFERNPFLSNGYQWFGLEEITPFNIRQGLDKAGPKLLAYLQELLQERRLTANELILVGFSQGAMIALEMIFLMPQLRGVVAYSGAFVPPPSIAAQKVKTEVLLVHGTMDTVVPYAAFMEAERQLKKLNINVTDLTCPGVAHYIDSNGLDAGREFIKKFYGKIDEIIYL